MSDVVREQQQPGRETVVAADAATTAATESVIAGDVVEAVDDDDGSLFQLLARRARMNNPFALLTTAIGGSADAAIVWSHYPGLRWLAVGFVAVASYGIWGLADFGMEKLRPSTGRFDLRRDFLAAVRDVSVPAGVIAAIGAVGGFMAAALGGWQH